MVWVIPLSAVDVSTRGLTPVKHMAAFRVCQDLVGGETPASNFRRVRAISQFDWPFTPTRSSSKNFSTFTGSALHGGLAPLQPGRV